MESKGWVLKIDPIASLHREELLVSIAERHNPDIANDVGRRIKEVLNLLSSLPFMWPSVQTRKLGIVRKATVDKLTLIFYVVTEDEVHVLDIIDARSDWL